MQLPWSGACESSPTFADERRPTLAIQSYGEEGAAALRSDLLVAAGVPHAFGTRRGGVSEGRYNSANRGFFSQDAPGNLRSNWVALLEHAGIPEATIYHLRQVHGTAVLEVPETGEVTQDWARLAGEGDGLETRRAGVGLAVQTADCVPVLVASGTGMDHRVAAIHSGWRGTVAGVLPQYLRRGGVGNWVVALGPHIRRCCFEVGPEVAAEAARAARAVGGSEDQVLAAGNGDRSMLDLEALLLLQLGDLGAEDGQIDAGAPCTHCSPDLFFSYRRDGPGYGSLGCVIGIGTPGS
jgi:YfiH family protein